MNSDLKDSDKDNQESENISQESNFESYINDLAKQVQEYDAQSNEEKIENIDEYNKIQQNINNYEEELEGYKTKLMNIETKKPIKKKSVYGKNSFANDMDSLVTIKNTISSDNSSSKNMTIDELMDNYETIVEIQKRVIPYLENKKMEIIKL